MGKNVSLGIDLGTGFSAASILQNGIPQVISNSSGGRTTPSIVAYTKGGILVGSSAKRQAVTNPKNTVYEVKRLIGRKFSDKDVQEFKKNAPFDIVAGDNDEILIDIDGRKVTPIEISALVLAEMKKTAEEYLGQEVKNAVITVPARFNQQQREATKDAAKIAGLSVDRLVNEPTAASLAYGISSGKEQKVIVFDCGSGTHDVSLLSIGDDVVEVLSSGGCDTLGGKDFDQLILDWLADEFKKLEGIDLKEDKIALQRLKEAAEQAKIELSSSLETSINLPFIAANNDEAKHLNMSLTRAKFEGMVDHLIKKTIDPCKTVLKETMLSKKDIDAILLVGGTSRIPAIQAAVEVFFGKKPDKSLDPDLAISMGAAIQASIISGENTDLLLLDCTSLSIGLETLGGIATKIVEKNTTIPCQRKQIFSTAQDNQESVTISVVQGEREMAADNKVLGRFDLTGIPAAARGIPQIEVCFDIDSDSILTVSAKDLGTGKEQSIKIESSSGLSKEDIARMVLDAEEHVEADKAKRALIEAKNQAESTVYQMEKTVKDNKEKITDDEATTIDSKIAEVRALLIKEDVTVDELNAKVEELNSSFHPIAAKLYAQPAPDMQEPPTTEGAATN